MFSAAENYCEAWSAESLERVSPYGYSAIELFYQRMPSRSGTQINNIAVRFGCFSILARLRLRVE